jgi:hypothetical protein
LKTILIGDVHFPWSNEQYLNRILDRIDKMQPDYVIQMGDLYDFYSFSRYPRSQNVMKPKDELLEARSQAEAMWEAIRTAAPKAKRRQILGNHDDRILKMVQNKAPELEAVLEALDYRALWRFDGVKTQPDSASELELPLFRGEKVIVHHGHRAQLGDHVKYNLDHTAVAHTHKGGVFFTRRRGQTLWELNCGYVADQRAKALSYGIQRLSDSVPGYGVIDNDGPRFIAL